MLKIAFGLIQTKEVIEDLFSEGGLQKAEYHIKKLAQDNDVSYDEYLQFVITAREISATTRLLAIYLLYIN